MLQYVHYYQSFKVIPRLAETLNNFAFCHPQNDFYYGNNLN